MCGCRFSVQEGSIWCIILCSLLAYGECLAADPAALAIGHLNLLPSAVARLEDPYRGAGMERTADGCCCIWLGIYGLRSGYYGVVAAAVGVAFPCCKDVEK